MSSKFEDHSEPGSAFREKKERILKIPVGPTSSAVCRSSAAVSLKDSMLKTVNIRIIFAKLPARSLAWERPFQSKWLGRGSSTVSTCSPELYMQDPSSLSLFDRSSGAVYSFGSLACRPQLLRRPTPSCILHRLFRDAVYPSAAPLRYVRAVAVKRNWSNTCESAARG